MAKFSFKYDLSIDRELDFIAILETTEDIFQMIILTLPMEGRHFYWYWIPLVGSV